MTAMLPLPAFERRHVDRRIDLQIDIPLAVYKLSRVRAEPVGLVILGASRRENATASRGFVRQLCGDVKVIC